MFDHIGFNVTDFAKSKEFFLRALQPLGIGVVAPRRWLGNYYGAFVIGPDGHNVEAVCHTAEG